MALTIKHTHELCFVVIHLYKPVSLPQPCLSSSLPCSESASSHWTYFLLFVFFCFLPASPSLALCCLPPARTCCPAPSCTRPWRCWRRSSTTSASCACRRLTP